MEIGVSTACFYPELLTEETIKVISNMGFKKIEVFLETISEYELEYCRNLKEIIEEEGLEVYSVHSFAAQHEPFLFDKYRPRREDARRLFHKVLEGSNVLGAKCVTFHGPGRKWLGTEDVAIKDIARVMESLAAEAEVYNISLAWENVYWCLSYNPDLMGRVMEMATSTNINFTLDLKQANRSGVDVARYLEVMGKRLINVHINDYSPGNMCLLPGRGQADYRKLFKALRELDYSGPLIIEVYRNNFFDYEEISESRDFLLSLME
jgi:sugar phosphate isomerase/epimerase